MVGSLWGAGARDCPGGRAVWPPERCPARRHGSKAGDRLGVKQVVALFGVPPLGGMVVPANGRGSFRRKEAVRTNRLRRLSPGKGPKRIEPARGL